MRNSFVCGTTISSIVPRVSRHAHWETFRFCCLSKYNIAFQQSISGGSHGVNVCVDLSTLHMGMCLVVKITVCIDSSRSHWLACLSVEMLDSSAYWGQHTHVMWPCRLYFQGLQMKLFLDAHLLAFLLLELGHYPSQLEVQNLLQICTLLNLSRFFLNRQSQQTFSRTENNSIY